MSSNTAFRLSLYIDPTCSGQGTPTFVPSLNQTLCLCNDYFSGGGDFFDTRIFPPYSLTCENSRIGELVIWSLCLASGALRCYKLIFALRERFRHFETTRKYTWRKTISNDIGAKFMFIDLVMVTNFFVITSALKISGQVLGTDIACTVFLIVLVAVHQFSLISMGQIEFHALVSPIGKELSAKLIRVKLIFDYLGFLSYLLGVIIPSLVCLGLDKSKDPITNGEFIIVILRNIFVIFWSFGEGVAVQMVQKRAHLMLANSNNIASSPQNQKLQRVLTTLHLESRRHALTFFMLTLMYSGFLLPWLWSQQTFVIGFSLFIFSLRRADQKFSLKNQMEETNQSSNQSSTTRQVEPQAGVTEAYENTAVMVPVSEVGE